MRKNYPLTLFTLMSLLFAIKSNAANSDYCSTSIPITIGTSCSYYASDNYGATHGGNASCGSTTSPLDVWFNFTATGSSATITVVGGSTFDAVFDVYASCTSSAMSGSCTDNNFNVGGTETKTITGLSAGTTYYIRVYEYSNAAGTFNICVTGSVAGPSNDFSCNATSINVNTSCTNTNGSTVGATQSYSVCGTSSNTIKDVWYKFTATATTATITAYSSTLDLFFRVYSDCYGSTFSSCVDALIGPGTETTTLSGLTPSAVYYIRLADYYGSTGSFALCVTGPGSSGPPNDLCGNATTLTPGTSCSYTSGTVSGAGESMLPISCGTYSSTAAYDVWYKFTANGPNMNIQVAPSSSFDAVLGLYSQPCGSLITCADASGQGSTETINATGLSNGTVYYIRVYHYTSNNSYPSTPTFNVCVWGNPSGPSNDDCSNATAINMGTSCNYSAGTLSGATQSTSPINCSGTSSTAYDVWYKFTASASTATITVGPNSIVDAVVALYSSCGGSSIACADAGVGGGTENIYATGLSSGSTYYIRVYHYGGSIPSSPTFLICVYNGGAANTPPNNDCTNATTLNVYSACITTAGTIAGATQSTTPIICNGSSPTAYDVWYKFTATATTMNIKVNPSSSFDAVIGLYNGCGGGMMFCADNSTSGGGSETITATGLGIGGIYYIRVHHYGSSMPSTTFFDICVYPPNVGMDEESINAMVSLFPNPANELVTIETTLSDVKYISLFSVDGKLAKQFSTEVTKNKYDLQLGDFASGIYYLQLIGQEGTVTKRLVIE